MAINTRSIILNIRRSACVFDNIIIAAAPVERPEVKKKKKPAVVVVSPTDRPEDEQESEEKTDSRRGRSLVFDEKSGEVVVKRERKRGRGRPEWEDFDADDL